MKFGVLSVVDHYPSELPRTTAQLYGELLEQAESADALGFDSFWVAEPHFHEYGAVPRPPVPLNVAPLQRPRPPVWIAVLRNDAAVEVGVADFP